MNNLLGSMRKTIQAYQLIEAGDRVAVGLSGGKDSMALLYMLKKFQRFTKTPYHLEAITIDKGFQNFDFNAAKAFCASLEIPYTIVPTDIAKIVFELRSEKNPCALCANMRRGALADAMNQRGLNKLALGHHQDDAITTLMLNMFYTGKLNTLEYKSFLSRSQIHVIRPFLDANEYEVLNAIKKHKIPVIKSPCPVDKKTKRESMATLMKTINQEIPSAKKNLATAMRNQEQCNLFKNNKSSSL